MVVNEALVVETLTLIGASTVLIALLSRLGLPSILGYLFAGLLVGPFVFGLVPPREGAHFLAEIGLILLMFMVGLEFSWAELWTARRAVFVGGSLQIGVTMALATLLAHAFGVPWPAALLAGGAAAMCSTGIALKQLQERKELVRPHGRFAISILLFQDVAVLPFLVVIDSAGTRGSIDFLPALRQLAIAALALGTLLWLGSPILRAALIWIGKRKSVDLFLLASLLLALGTAYVAERLDAAPTIGAFLAGVAVGESDIKHRVSEQLAPFRDMLLGLFFVTAGMQVDPAVIAAAPVRTALWLVFFVLMKPLFAAVALRVLGYDVINSLRAATVLAHAGELSLLILWQAMNAGLLPVSAGQPMLLAAAASMGLAPLAIDRNRVIAAFTMRTLRRLSPRIRASLDADQGEHVHRPPPSTP
jgi:CPA2 family monovalent cation:H+ antiporter-2